MNIFRYLKKPTNLHLHALEPNETWYERSYWLALFVKELKAERDALRTQVASLLQQVKGGEPLSVMEEEYLAMRQELNAMYKAKAKSDARVTKLMQVNRSLMDEVDDLRQGVQRAA